MPPSQGAVTHREVQRAGGCRPWRTVRDRCHPSEDGATHVGCQRLGSPSRVGDTHWGQPGAVPPPAPQSATHQGCPGGSPAPPTPRHVGTRGDAHLVAAGAGAAGLAGGGAVRWVAPQEGAGGTGLAGTSAVVQGVPGGAGGTEPPSGGTAAAEGSHPPQHVGDIDGVELGHITGVTPALERSSASPSAGWNGGGGGVTLLSPSLCPHSPPRGSACAGRPR